MRMLSVGQRITTVPFPPRGVRLEASEHLLRIPVTVTGLSDHLLMPGHRIRKRAHRGPRLPQTERCEATNRRLSDTHDVEQALGGSQLGVDFSSSDAELSTGPPANFGPRDDRDRAVRGADRELFEWIDPTPFAVPTDRAQPNVPRLRRALPAASNAVLGLESVEIGLVIPHGKQRSAREIGTGPGVVTAAGSEQSPEPQPLDTVEHRSIDPESRQRDRRLPAGFPNEMKGRDASHASDMLAAMGAINDAVADWSTTPVDIAIVVLLGYLIGSIPIANVIARRRASVDLREVGDRNPGFWNARETMGRMAAVPVFVGDVAKGLLAAGLGAALADDGVWGMAYVGGGAAMVGHSFPIFARFVGGRSVLTFVGTVLVATPLATLISVGVLLATFVITRSFAWGARVGMIVLPFVQLAVEGPHRTAATGLLMTFIGLRFAVASRSNRALVAGSEPSM